MNGCVCPDNGILEDIPTSTCAFDMAQIQKIVFATKGKVLWDSATGGGTGNGVPQVNSQLDTLADWTARLSAVNDTKIVVTPFIGGDPIIESGDAITEGGGDNSTLDGVELVTGVNPSKFSAIFKSLEPAQEKALKKIMCKDVEVYFLLQGGKIACVKVDGTVNHKGFPVESFFVSDRSNAGFGTQDANTISFSMASGWSEDMVMVTPAFNPLTSL